jgi:hypothetical protein
MPHLAFIIRAWRQRHTRPAGKHVLKGAGLIMQAGCLRNAAAILVEFWNYGDSLLNPQFFHGCSLPSPSSLPDNLRHMQPHPRNSSLIGVHHLNFPAAFFVQQSLARLRHLACDHKGEAA